jgi:hypothetical protein
MIEDEKHVAPGSAEIERRAILGVAAAAAGGVAILGTHVAGAQATTVTFEQTFRDEHSRNVLSPKVRRMRVDVLERLASGRLTHADKVALRDVTFADLKTVFDALVRNHAGATLGSLGGVFALQDAGTAAGPGCCCCCSCCS